MYELKMLEKQDFMNKEQTIILNEQELLIKYRGLVETNTSTDYLKKMVIEILSCDRYEFVSTEVPFINLRGTISYDYSGEVQLNNAVKIDEELTIEEAFGSVYTGQREATYTSNYGWHYPSFLDDLERRWEEYKSAILSNFIAEHEDIIVKMYNIQDKEYLYDDIDNTPLMEYHIFDNDFFQTFIKRKIGDCLPTH